MRWLAIFLNVGLLAFIAYGITKWGLPTEDRPFVYIALVCAVVNLIARIPPSNHPRLLTLYLQRRRLEEQAKIDSLNAANR